MPITRKLISQDGQEDNQIMAIDNLKRYIINDDQEWQFLFGPNSGFTNSGQVLKIAAEFDTNDFNSIRVIGYLYNTNSGAIDSAASVSFTVSRVATTLNPQWDDQPMYSVAGVIMSNSYFFADINLSSLAAANLDGDTTLMIEAIAVRLGRTYRDRIYINHLGVYDSIVRLRNDVDFLDITKLDE